MHSLATAGQARVQATFTLDSMISRVEQLYDMLAHEKIDSRR
jgi:hypothetical protein